MSQREAILERLNELPALPVGSAGVITLGCDPDADTADIVRAIELDPGLTTNVLRMANSVYFAGPQQISSIRDALMRLGVKRVVHLAVAAAIVPAARQPVSGYDLQPGDLLRHCVGVAIGAEELASALGIQPPSEAFTAGLLHDIGKIVLGTFIAADPAPIMQMAFKEHISFEEAERHILGIDHAAVGAELLAAWALPASIVDATRWHHNPDECKEPSLTLDLVHMANLLMMMGGIGTGSDGLNYRASRLTVHRLEITTQATELALSRTLNALGQVQEQLEV